MRVRDFLPSHGSRRLTYRMVYPATIKSVTYLFSLILFSRLPE